MWAWGIPASFFSFQIPHPIFFLEICKWICEKIELVQSTDFRKVKHHTEDIINPDLVQNATIPLTLLLYPPTYERIRKNQWKQQEQRQARTWYETNYCSSLTVRYLFKQTNIDIIFNKCLVKISSNWSSYKNPLDEDDATKHKSSKEKTILVLSQLMCLALGPSFLANEHRFLNRIKPDHLLQRLDEIQIEYHKKRTLHRTTTRP